MTLSRKASANGTGPSFLETQLNDVEREFSSLAFPRYTKFDFVCFVVFAILGVIFPLTYGVWGEYLLEDNESIMFLIFHANNIALSLFGKGLALMFVYMGLELLHALAIKNE
jgi:hypothetical protein